MTKVKKWPTDTPVLLTGGGSTDWSDLTGTPTALLLDQTVSQTVVNGLVKSHDGFDATAGADGTDHWLLKLGTAIGFTDGIFYNYGAGFPFSKKWSFMVGGYEAFYITKTLTTPLNVNFGYGSRWHNIYSFVDYYTQISNAATQAENHVYKWPITDGDGVLRNTGGQWSWDSSVSAGLALDQTVEQHVINGSPHFDEGITVAKDKWVYLDG